MAYWALMFRLSWSSVPCERCSCKHRSILHELSLEWLPVHRDWRLNERHYGALQVLASIKQGRRCANWTLAHSISLFLSLSLARAW